MDTPQTTMAAETETQGGLKAWEAPTYEKLPAAEASAAFTGSGADNGTYS